MIIRIKFKKKYTPFQFANNWVNGGLTQIYSPRKPSFSNSLTEYSRTMTKLRARTRLGQITRSSKRYFFRLRFSVRRLLKLHNSPTLALRSTLTNSVKLTLKARIISWWIYLVQFCTSFFFDGIFQILDYLKRYYRFLTNSTAQAEGTRAIDWSMIQRVKFKQWALSGSKLQNLSRWPSSYRFRKQNNPFLKRFAFNDIQIVGSISSTRFSSRSFTHQIKGLLRRKRAVLYYHKQLLQLHESYLRYYYGKSRRKLKKNLFRYHSIRRRRIRSYRSRFFTLQTYFRGITKISFQKIKLNRLFWLEQSQVLTNSVSYSQVLGRWVTLTLNSRVGLPIEYNYFKPREGYNRIIQKRNENSRRWKLLQHPRLSYWFKVIQLEKNSWFSNTKLFQITSQYKDRSDPQKPPLETSFLSSLYWSNQPWGRSSRWRTRPEGRARKVFLRSLNSGTSFEHDYDSWGLNGMHRVITLFSLQTLIDFRPTQILSSGRRKFPFFRFRPSSSFRGWLFYFLMKVVTLFWFVFVTPVWWIYLLLGQFYSIFLYMVSTFWWTYLIKVIFTIHHFNVHFWFRNLFLPFRSFCWSWVKDRPFLKNLGWVYTSWVMVYSSEDDRPNTMIHNEDQEENDITFDENFDLHQEHEVDFDQLNEETYNGWGVLSEHQSPWQHEIDSFWDEFWETIEIFIYEEIPYAFRLFFRPWVNFFRLPFWGVLEKITLLVVVLRIESQIKWLRWLTQPGFKGIKRLTIFVRTLFQLILLFTSFIAINLTVDWSVFSLFFQQTLSLPVEEYILWAWHVFVFLALVRLIGPRSWKNYLFHDLGWSTLFLSFMGVTSLLTPENYYLSRSGSPFTTLEYRASGLGVGYWPRYPQTQYTNRMEQLYNIEVEKIPLRTTQHLDGPEQAPISYDPIEDQNGFVFSAHLNVDETYERYETLYNTAIPMQSTSFIGNSNRQSQVFGSYDSQLTYNNRYNLQYKPIHFSGVMPPVHSIPFTTSEENEASSED